MNIYRKIVLQITLFVSFGFQTTTWCSEAGASPKIRVGIEYSIKNLRKNNPDVFKLKGIILDLSNQGLRSLEGFGDVFDGLPDKGKIKIVNLRNNPLSQEQLKWLQSFFENRKLSISIIPLADHIK
jgi:hypothetical protein